MRQNPDIAKIDIAKTGIGLRAPHVAEILRTRPETGFLEAHAENYFRIGSAPFAQLMKCREAYPVSLHGVGLSLGSADGVDRDHLAKFKALAKEVDPVFISEHISWSGADGVFVPDLLPLPFTQEALEVISNNISVVQNELGRQIMAENPSSYVTLDADMTEPRFIAEIVSRSGCKLLLDVNNIHVSAHNLGFDPYKYLDALPLGIVGEIHLAGYQDNGGVYVDAHNHPVYDPVWKLYEAALGRFGDTPTLVEWDNDLPPLDTLMIEAHKADAVRARVQGENNVRVA